MITPTHCSCGIRTYDCDKHRPQRGHSPATHRYGKRARLGEWVIGTGVHHQLEAFAQEYGTDLDARTATDEEIRVDPNLGIRSDDDGDYTANHYYYGSSTDGIPESNQGVPMDRARWVVCSINGRWPHGASPEWSFLCWMWDERRAAISQAVDAVGFGKRGIRLDASSEGDEWVLRNYDNKAEIGRIQ